MLSRFSHVQLCATPGSSVHEISQARILEWVAISFSRGSSQPRDWTQVSWIAGRFFTVWATREASNTHIKTSRWDRGPHRLKRNVDPDEEAQRQGRNFKFVDCWELSSGSVVTTLNSHCWGLQAMRHGWKIVFCGVFFVCVTVMDWTVSP